MLSAFITGLAGLELDPHEAAALRAARPCGVILFARNVADPAQVRRLSEAARDAVGSDILVLVDQEGGRVRRLQPPHWRQLPAAAAYGRLYAGGRRRGLPHRAAGGAADGGRAARLRDRHQLRAGARRAGARQPRHHRRSRLWRRRRAGRRAGACRRRGPHRRRRAAGDEARTGPRPGDQGQPPGAAGGHGRRWPSWSARTSLRFAPAPICRRP